MKTKILPFLITLLLSNMFTNAQNGGYALEFDGTNDYVNLGQVANPSSLSALTLECWVNVDDLTKYNRILSQDYIDDSDPGFGWFNININNGKVYTFLFGSINSSAQSLQQNKWTHLALVWDGSNIKFYFNGVQDANVHPVSSLSSSDNDLYLGWQGHYNNTYFGGNIDEVRIWNTARTEAQIKANMYKELAGTETGLTAYYKMSDGTGTSLTDNSTNTNTGTLTNGPSWKASAAFAGSRQALDFDGSNDYVNFSSSPEYNNNAVTIEAWIQSTNSGNEKDIVSWGSNSGLNDNVQLRMQAGKLQFGMDVSGWVSIIGNTNINTGKWTHVAMVKNGNDVSLYVNGKLDASGSINLTPTVPKFFISAHYKNGVLRGFYFPGQIDEVRIWNTTRTEAEIRESMMRTLAGNESGLVAYYRFDQYDGTTLFDMTSNAKNGTLTNMDAATDWVASSAFTTWIGSESTVWNTGTNWSDGTPSNTSNIGVYDWSSTVPNVTVNFPVKTIIDAGNLWLPAETSTTIKIGVNGSAFLGGTFNLDGTNENSAANLVIQSGSNITLPANGKLTVSAYLENKGTLNLNNLASLKTEGTISNTGIINMHKTLSGNNAWQMISSPAVADISDNGWNPTVGNDDFYAWHEASPGTWVNYHVTSGDLNFPTVNGGGDNFVAAKGYLVSYQAATVNKTITGTPNTGTQSFTLQNTGAKKAWDYLSGWNLIGNPYPSYINWNLVDRSLFVDNYAYWYNPNKEGGANYEYINGSNVDAYLAPFQGFFVLSKLTSNNTNFTFTDAMRSHGSASKANETEGLILRLGNETYYDETRIARQNESQNTRDRLDALKMYSFNPQVPQLYSFSADGLQLAVNSIPSAEADEPVALGALLPADGAYTMSLQQTDETMVAHGLYLEDRLTGNFHKLSATPYEFTATQGSADDRFLLHFGVVGVDETTPPIEGPIIWHQGDRIYFKGAEFYQEVGDCSICRGDCYCERYFRQTNNSQSRLLSKPGYTLSGFKATTAQLPKRYLSIKFVVKVIS